MRVPVLGKPMQRLHPLLGIGNIMDFDLHAHYLRADGPIGFGELFIDRMNARYFPSGLWVGMRMSMECFLGHICIGFTATIYHSYAFLSIPCSFACFILVSVNVHEFVMAAERQLQAAGVATGRLDALVLLEDALGVERAQLLAHPETAVPADIQNVLKSQLERRTRHEPLAYVRGRTEFYGREFIVSPAVLEPRPESETMIDLLKKHVSEDSSLRSNDDEASLLTIVDVGTGSGALAITAKSELPEATVLGVDVDQRCLEIAKRNAKMHDVKITLATSDLLSSLTLPEESSGLVLLCNLPYVPDEHTINAAALHEPRIAIFGGPDGLDLYRKLFRQLENVRNRPLLILSESLPPQHEALRTFAGNHDFEQIDEDDFIQAFERV